MHHSSGENRTVLASSHYYPPSAPILDVGWVVSIVTQSVGGAEPLSYALVRHLALSILIKVTRNGHGFF